MSNFMVRNAVEVTEAGPRLRNVFANLAQFYVYDFADTLPPESAPPLLASGRFPELPYLDHYWGSPDRIPLLIHVRGAPAGFALVNEHSMSGRPVDRAMGEFFIMRPHRRTGVGLAALRQILEEYPGWWEVAVMRDNAGALGFWRAVLGRLSRVRELSEIDRDDARWNGSIFRFRADAE